MLKNTLLSTSPDVAKLRSQFAVLIAPTSEREDRDRKRRKSQSGHGALFMVGGFALSSLSDETPEAAGVSAEGQLTPEMKPPLRDEKGRFSRKKTDVEWKTGREDSWDKGVEGKEEIRLSRNGRGLVPTEEKRNPFKSGVV